MVFSKFIHRPERTTWNKCRSCKRATNATCTCPVYDGIRFHASWFHLTALKVSCRDLDQKPGAGVEILLVAPDLMLPSSVTRRQVLCPQVASCLLLASDSPNWKQGKHQIWIHHFINRIVARHCGTQQCDAVAQILKVPVTCLPSPAPILSLELSLVRCFLASPVVGWPHHITNVLEMR
eukprot:762723-Hanusia_phi.AAC.3